MDTDLAKTIGDAAKTARAALGITQEDAAERVGISMEFYARIERGATLPSVPTLVQLCRGLNVSADAFLGLERTKVAPRETPSAPSPQLDQELSSDARKLLRRVRKASPRVVRLLNLIAVELER